MKGLILKGKISIHPRGFGFVSNNKLPKDIFIPSDKTGAAFNGDDVEVKITSQSSKGYEGAVKRVVQSNKSILVGTVMEVTTNRTKVFLEDAGSIKELQITESPKVSVGDRILISIKQQLKDILIVTLVENFGSIKDATKDVLVTVATCNIRKKFSNLSLEEAKKIKIEKDSSREDLRDLETFTVDPVNALDYDDALSIQKTKDGGYKVYVHIADVSYFVKHGLHIDKEAYARGNSTYFVDQVIPMLPKKLSEDICSLVEGADRFVVSVEMIYDKQGNRKTYKIFRSVINSNKRFTYQSAQDILEKDQKNRYFPALSLLKELCLLIKQNRLEEGVLDFSLKELNLVLGKDGVPIAYNWEEYHIVHQMIEVLMIATNEIVATHLVKKGIPTIFRIHEQPDKENLDNFFVYSILLGYKIPKNPAKKDLQNVFNMASGTSNFNLLAINYIRSMKWALYSTENVGHYGLALKHYLHFTSPIRRYGDLVIHRQLFEKDYAPDLKKISQHCSESERNSFKAENALLKLKKMRYVETKKGIPMSATIKQIKPKLLLFDLDCVNLDGIVHTSTLQDSYNYYEKKQVLKSRRGNKNYFVGKSIHVALKDINLSTNTAVWELLEDVNS